MRRVNSSSVSRKGLSSSQPAQFTHTPITPSSARTRVTASPTDAGLVTSSHTPRPPTWAATRSAPARSRSATATLQPASARLAQIAAPTPPDPPVTSATRGSPDEVIVAS